MTRGRGSGRKGRKHSESRFNRRDCFIELAVDNAKAFVKCIGEERHEGVYPPSRLGSEERVPPPRAVRGPARTGERCGLRRVRSGAAEGRGILLPHALSEGGDLG